MEDRCGLLTLVSAMLEGIIGQNSKETITVKLSACREPSREDWVNCDFYVLKCRECQLNMNGCDDFDEEGQD